MSVSKVIPASLDSYLRKPDEPDRVFPKNKKIEVVFLIEAVNAILPRTEGVEDITLIKLPGTEYEVPVILPEKLQAVSRRRMLAQLRKFRDIRPNQLAIYLKTLTAAYSRPKRNNNIPVGFTKAKKYAEEPHKWNCFIQPPGGDIKEATDVGMDGFCPACALFGTVLGDTGRQDKRGTIYGIADSPQQAISAGVKSRVEFDPAIAFLDKERSVASYTHNKVSDGVSWTGKSLYEEQHVVPGTVFVGKVTLEDVTETELQAFLAILSTIDRLGGRERVFGGVRIHVIGVRGGSYESTSALEIARMLAKEFGNGEYPPSIDEVKEKTSAIIKNKGFLPIDIDDIKKLLDNMDLWDKLWSETVEYDKQILRRILDLVKGKDKYEEV